MGGEQAFIERLEALLPSAPVGTVWLGDDAAVLDDGRLLAAVDTLVEGVHFDLRWSSAEDAGWKAVAVNVSDVAAMAGRPTACLVAIVVPADPPGLADRVLEGASAAARAFGCPIVGGDTTAGPSLVVSVSILGAPGARGPVLRSGARPGHHVFVTGSLGAGRRALAVLAAGGQPPTALAVRLHRPHPRIEAGEAAAEGGASAMIDLSDGLGTDLGHICDASEVGVRLDAQRIPVAEGASLDDALVGGDDYELCFTAPDSDAVVEAFSRRGLDAPVLVGEIVEDVTHRVVDMGDGEERVLSAGWEHEVR